MMGFSRLSRFGMTFKPLTADRGEELLMSYLEGFHAKTFPQPEKAQESTESDQACGPTWRGSLAKFDPATSSWKTAQCSLLEEEPELLQTLPRSGMTVDGMLLEQQTVALRTNATEFGLWPTPVKSDHQARRPSKNWAGTDLPSMVWRRNGGIENPNKPPVKLNPKWVAWLMGWPLGWTNLRPLETDKFRLWQQQHGDC